MTSKLPPFAPREQQPSAPPLDDEDSPQLILPPLAVPLGYGSGAPPPPSHLDANVPAVPVYRQQLQSAAAYQTPPLPSHRDIHVSPTPPQPLGMQRPHRTYHHHMHQRPQSPPGSATARSRCAGVMYFCKLLLFNIANGALGVGGFLVVTTGLIVALVSLPLCCFGVVLARVLLRVVYFLAKLDAVLHNVIADDDEKIQFRHVPVRYGAHRSLAAGEDHALLLPTHHHYHQQHHLVDWQLQPHHSLQDDDQLPQFEDSLANISPRAVLATIYFGSIKFLVGVFSIIAVSLVALVLAVFCGGGAFRADLQLDDDTNALIDSDDPVTLYLFALGLGVFAVALLFANARISQAITRFFCCEGGL